MSLRPQLLMVLSAQLAVVNFSSPWFLFDGSGTQEKRNDIQVSIDKTWEKAWGSCKESGRLDAVGITEMMGILGGKIVEPPSWWVNALKNSDVRDARLYFSEPVLQSVSDGRKNSHSYYSNLRIGWELNKLVLRNKGTRTVFDTISRSDHIFCHPNCIVLDKQCFVVIPHADSASSYRVLLYDLTEKEIRWEAEAIAAGEHAVDQGPSWHITDLSSTDTTLIVFGLGFECAYFEVFERSTGNRIARFSTSMLY